MRVAAAEQVLAETVARRLGPLRREAAFLGGAAVSLLLSEEGAPVCRWEVGGVLVDVMPTPPDVLGFSNQRYAEAFATATEVRIAQDLVIRLVSPPYFLATKIEAFRSRGGGDFLSSHDMEDLVAVLDGRSDVVDEIARSAAPLRRRMPRGRCEGS